MSIKTYIVAGALVGAAALGLHSCNYVDYAGYSKHTSDGRTRNSIATMVTGAVAEQIAPGNATIDMQVQKQLYANSRITGSKTPTTIETTTDLAFAHNDLHANIVNGQMRGTIAKSEYDWQVTQANATTYNIARANFKFDTTLTIQAKDGKITGTYSHPLAFDWKISGTYSKNGNVHIDIDAPLSTANMTLEGRITPK